MKQKTKWFITSLMLVMVCLQATAQPEGKFYLYNSAKAFLSRAANGNATVDKFGIPVEVKKSDAGCSLMFLDNGRYVSQSGSTVKGDETSAAYATITADGDNYTVALKEGEFLGVDGSNGALAVKADASASGFNAKWQLLTQAERDVIVADMELAQIEAVAKAAGITLAVGTDKMTQFTEALKAFSSEDATDLISNPTLATSQDGWTVNVLAGNNNIDYKSQYAMTLYQNTALEISQFLEVPNGIYKATIQNTYRSSKRETLTAYSLSEDHLSICNAYFAANENQAQAVEWSKIRTSATLPYSRGDFENFTTNSKYTTTVWAYVNDGKLTLKYVVPSINNSGGDYDLDWFTFANVKLTRYFQPSETTEEFNLYDEIVTQSSDPSAYNAVKQAFMDDFAKGTMTEEEVTAAKAALKAELFKMMKTVPALWGQYDITSLLTNSTLDSNIKGWKSSPVNAFKVANKLVESFGSRTVSSFSQVISDMPAGEYTVKVQGFYRNGEWKQALANYERGKDNVKAAIYVDDVANKQPLKSIFADGCYMLEGKHHKSADVFAVVSGKGYPHSHYIDANNRSNAIKTPDIAKQAIDHGHYWNEMVATHAADGDLTIGITLETGAPAESWIVIDNFRLYYGTPAPVIVNHIEGVALPPAVFDDTHAPVILKKQFKANELTPLAVPCDIPASKFKAVYAIGSLDEETKTAVLCPVDHVSANVPCYVVANEDVDEIKIDEPTLIAAAQPDQLPVMWDGGLVYRVADSFTWKAITLSENEVDASYFTNFEYVDAKNMDFVANIENFRARQYLQNTKYPEPDTKSVIENYFKPAPPRLDIPHNIGVPVPADKVKDAVVKFGFKSDFSDAQSRIILDGSDMAYMPNLIPGNTYYFKVEAGGEVLTQGKFAVEGPVRMIYAPSINNIRDLGGWTVQDGKKVRYGLIYRGGEANGLHPSVEEDRQTLIDLGVGAEIDLRKDNNYDSGNGQVGKCAFGFPKADYFFKEGGYDCKLEHLTAAASKARYKQWFPFIVNHIKEGKAVYYHCVWGADRTGLVSVLLEGLLGLTQEQMNLEYELTSLSFAGLRPKSGYADGDHQKLIEKIKTYEGETLRDKFDTYWTKEVGVSQELIDEFRSIMLVGESDEPDAIEDLTVQDKSEIKAVYSITGTELPLSALNQAGIYVVKYKNGASRKIVVK
ncbi:MAG: tyrosine-protein phosphatase [Bacteroidaceae bacterium]|nr:tyrosine-protein phosphatase [Bacteroidaceae bacterium]